MGKGARNIPAEFPDKTLREIIERRNDYMKNMKKLVSVLLTLVMALALTVPAFAANVTVPSDKILEGHAFTAYQIFSGREEGGVLSDVQWGGGIDSTAFLSALKADTTYGNLFTNCATAADVAKVLSNNSTTSGLADRFAELAYAKKTGTGTPLNSGENTLADGYYLVVDTTANVGEGSAYNKALLQVVGNISIAVKTDAPTVEKKVKEGGSYGDVADCNIGDSVEFLLIGSVPDMSRYDTYKYIFHDTLSAGLTAPAQGEIKVYLSDDKVVDTNDTEVTSSFNITVNGQEITVSCNNLKTVSGISTARYVIVKYSAVLNEKAEIGLPGNINTVKLQYSNKPDQSGSGDNNTGNTPEDKVIVFTYELDTTKVDGQDTSKKLEGAKFVLLNADGTKVAKITGGKFDGWQDLPTAGSDGKITWADDTVLTSDANGLFKVIGLDEGTYKLREIVAPTGYNMLKEDINVVITATTSTTWDGESPNTALTKLEVTADNTAGTGDTNTGIAAITVVNNAGATLPETGGIGTTIFYVLGSILVLGAGILLVTKKRMGSEK